MKAEVKIPKGWRKMRPKELVRHGDRWLESHSMTWSPAVIYGVYTTDAGCFIRRNPKKARK